MNIEKLPDDIKDLIYSYKIKNDNYKATLIQSYWRRKNIINNLDILLINILDSSFKNTYRFLGLDITNEYVYKLLRKISENKNFNLKKYPIYQSLCYELEDSIQEYVYFIGIEKNKYCKSMAVYDKLVDKIIYFNIKNL
jgi:hypothetical protein